MAGDRLSAERAAGRIVRAADRFAVPSVAKIVAVDWDDTGNVVTENVVDVLPSGTVTEFGVIPLDKLLETSIDEPPGPAGPLIVKVPVTVAPPYTLGGFKVRVESFGGRMVKFAVFAVAPDPAVMVADACAFTPVVATVNVPTVLPAGIETEAGGIAVAMLDVNGIVAPADGAGEANVTVPVEDVPP